MNMVFWNLLLAIVWAISTGVFTLSNLVIGLVLGYFALLLSRRAIGDSTYFVRVPRAVRFAFFYLWQLILSNLRVAYDVITPGYLMRPGVIAVPLDARTDAEITLLANLITLTPGTLSLDLSDDRRILFVHAMYLDEDDARLTAKNIKDGLERRVLEVLR
jgi:multicomponent Na+:H+ antiporter subunit E